MRKLVVTEFLTLDGVMEGPDTWPGQYWTDGITRFKFDELFGSDAMLLGRITYEGFAQAWPSEKDEQGFADRMNGLPKYVVSTTLEKAEWNNSTLIKENVVEEVARLKQQPGQDILIHGSAELADSLLKAGLIDEYHLLVYPLVLGSGKRLFKEGSPKGLKLVDTQTFDSGVVALIYQPAEKEADK